MVWGGEKIYSGRGELIIIITPICTPQRGRDGMDCAGVVWMTCSINSSRHQLAACTLEYAAGLAGLGFLSHKDGL